MNNLVANVLRRSISRRVGSKQARHYSTQPSKPNIPSTSNSVNTSSTTSANATSSSVKLSAKQIRRELLRGNKVTKIASIASVLTFAGATGYYLYGTVSTDIIKGFFIIIIIIFFNQTNYPNILLNNGTPINIIWLAIYTTRTPHFPLDYNT